LQVDALARAFGAFADLKTPFTVGHSSGVATLAVTAATGVPGSNDIDVPTLRRAALLHDIGRVAIPNGSGRRLGRSAPRTGSASGYTRTTVSASWPVPTSYETSPSSRSSHHERQDGSGYHRGSSAGQLGLSARLLGAADAYQAMTQPRPHRPALTSDEAAAQLRADADGGRLDRAAVESVLEAAGHARRRTRAQLPGGLSERELEVLRLLCRGNTNREMAQHLHIAEKTAGHHVQHIYDKIGRATRAGAALFAMENDLLG